MEPQIPYLRRFWIALITVIAVIVLVFIVAFSRTRNANVELIAVPGDATFLIDKKSYPAGKVRIAPGSHQIEAQREGFETLSQAVEVTDELQRIPFALTPVSDEAKRWAQDHPDAYRTIEDLGSQLAQTKGQAFADKYPLTTKLPYDTDFYSINYSLNENQEDLAYIRVDSNAPIGRRVALQQIRDWGFDPTDYKIVFAGLNNPFDPTTREIRGE